MLRRLRALPLALALGFACGGLDTPDLQHGAVTGRIPGARAGAYAYVLGAPDVLAQAAQDGSFRLDQVPAGQPRIVLFDGSSGAESLSVQVDGASVSHLDPGRPLRPAGTILVAASPLSGALPTGLAFTVDGTPLRQVSGASGVAQLFPIPAGSFAVLATQPGFQDRRVDVRVEEGGSGSLELDLDVASEDQRRGCLSCGCEHGLACNPGDGRCYQCVTSADCGANGTCTPAHTCSYPQGTGQLCQACTGASDCQGGAGAACVNPTGAALAGYCSRTCSGSDACPSGFDCRDGACTASLSCLASTFSYGATCTEDRNCQAALKDGRCFPSDREKDTPGYCAAKVQAGCPAGFVPDPRGSGYCARSP